MAWVMKQTLDETLVKTIGFVVYCKKYERIE